MVAAMLFLAPVRWWAAPKRLVPVALAGWLALVAGLRVAWPPVIDHHDADAREVARALAEMRAGIAAAPASTRVVLENRVFPPAAFLGFKTVPRLAGVFMMHFPTDDVDGRRVAFSDDAATVAAAHRWGGASDASSSRPRARHPDRLGVTATADWLRGAATARTPLRSAMMPERWTTAPPGPGYRATGRSSLSR